MRAFVDQFDRPGIAHPPVDLEILAVIVDPARLFHPVAVGNLVLLQAMRADHRPIQAAGSVVAPVDDLVRRVVHQVGARSSGSVFLGAAENRLRRTREIHHDVAAAANQRLYEALPEKFRQRAALQVAVLGEEVEELPGRVVVALELQDRLPAHERRRVPVDDGADIILIENAVQPFGIDLAGLLVAAHEILGGAHLELFAAGVQVLVLFPHRLAGDVFGMLPIDTQHGISLKSGGWIAPRYWAADRTPPTAGTPAHRKDAYAGDPALCRSGYYPICKSPARSP